MLSPFVAFVQTCRKFVKVADVALKHYDAESLMGLLDSCGSDTVQTTLDKVVQELGSYSVVQAELTKKVEE